ncbi:hypothetical protein ACFC18_43205 [Streptomyces sp. NPDC056121]|uniref:hypothetical protein n=2 Tax=Streptomyces TaxID=1883 RepID=UPI0033230E86
MSRGGVMPQNAKDLVTKAEGAVRDLNKPTTHPDQIRRAQAQVNLALAQSNVELAAALNAFTESATKPTGTIKKLVEQLNKHLGAIAGKT